ncbi:extracellular solute-binding protein [Gilliamella sp. wkB112]|uniref:extracellular solute-binding protein n=1 Tax=Gilliamella sp. wkB112 TaxID=3120257 RepID=UPI00080DAD9E|nr:extracellular solute-binding protein [Gilliamella apicola]OCG03279.1 hypothetical protein A9G12_09440 [Gilliamella apicola]
MPTIKDIAKMAGVSHGTVSNVLNGRGNVSVQKIKLVKDAAKHLGYQLNLQAKILKQGSAKTISVILPNITSGQYSNLYDGLFSFLNTKGYELTLYLTYDAKEVELQFIQKIAVKRDWAVIVVSCLDNANSYYQTINIAKENIIFVYRKPKNAKQFITLDYEKAGQDIAKEMMAQNYKYIGLFSNSNQHTHSHSFKKGFKNLLNKYHYSIDLQCIESTPSESSYSLAYSFFSQQQKNFEAIITMDIERAHYVRNANFFGSLEPCPPIYTLANNYFTFENDFYQYHMNYGILSQQIVNLIEGKKTVKLENKGFSLLPNFLSKKVEKTTEVLNFLILPSPSTEAIKKLLPHFKKTSGIDVNLIIKPFDEIYSLLDHLEQHKEIDIIRIDMAGLPWFAAKKLKPLIELNMNLKSLFAPYMPEIVDRFGYINDIAYAIPFDPSIQMLFYRKDLFNNPLIKRAYFEKYRQHLEVPKDFIQFDQIAAFFNRQQNLESPVEFGSCVTIGNAEIIASEFLLRYYAQGGKLINNNQLNLNKSIALSTLSQFKCFIQAQQKINATWWQESVNQFEQGRLAMLIVYMNLFTYVDHKNILPLVGYAAVPGNKTLFGGGSLGMSKYSNKNVAVKSFFDWLYSKEISEQMALLGGATARDTIFQNHRIINYYPWLQVAKQHFIHGVRENQLDTNQPIDLRYIEKTIGQYLLKWMNKQYSSERIIDEINQELTQNKTLIVAKNY